MPDHDHHLFEHLTQAEWKICFAIAFTASSDLFGGSYPIDEFATPGHPGDTWEELFRQAIRYLAMEHFADFAGIHVNREGVIVEYRVVQPENALYVTKMKAGGLPGSPKAAIEEALELAPHTIPSLDLEPLRACLATIEEHLAAQRAAVDPSRMRERYDADQRALGAIGVAPIRELIN